MSILIITDADEEKVHRMVEDAKAKPVPLEILKRARIDNPRTPVVTLDQRPPDFQRPRSRDITFMGGFRAAISFEEQPSGLCSHLSVSVEGRARQGMMPNEPAISMIAKTFGVPYPADKMWIEEYEPGEFAINLLSRWERP